MVKHATTLDDKYTAAEGRVLISSVQSLVRLPIVQKQRDTAAGLTTAGYITGYRGSPIGVYDAALWGAKDHLAASGIEFIPGVNEELAAATLRGTQQLHWYPKPRYDGIFSIYYAKILKAPQNTAACLCLPPTIMAGNPRRRRKARTSR
jgi:indolepyruvate ferredoxin oxidoreductase